MRIFSVSWASLQNFPVSGYIGCLVDLQAPKNNNSGISKLYRIVQSALVKANVPVYRSLAMALWVVGVHVQEFVYIRTVYRSIYLLYTDTEVLCMY